MQEKTREEARETLRKHVICKNYLKKSDKGGYICPFCGSGTGPNKTGGVKYYPETNTICCFARCDPDPGRKGKSYDVIDLHMNKYGMDYDAALKDLAQRNGITIISSKHDRTGGRTYPAPGKSPAGTENAGKSAVKEKPTGTPAGPQNAAESVTAQPAADHRKYYVQCMDRLTDPDAVQYIEGRGISLNTAKQFRVGYDPAADPINAPGGTRTGKKFFPAKRLIYPAAKHFYATRRIDGITDFDKVNCGKPVAMSVYNGDTNILNSPDTKVVFVTEGVFSALSIMEAGYHALSLNSKNNIYLLVDHLRGGRGAEAMRKVYVLCLDNDNAGRKSAETLIGELKRYGVKYINATADICADGEDPNDALMRDRAAFVEAVKAAAERAEAIKAEDLPKEGTTEPGPLPGLLTYEAAADIFQNANDDIITIKSFPEFSKMAKIRLHDSVVIAADTGVGKSSLALNFLHDLNEEYPCIYINLEMDTIEVLRRLCAIHTGMEIDRIEGYKQDEKTAAAVNISLKALTSRKPLQIIKGRYTDRGIECNGHMVQNIENIIARSTVRRKEPTIVFIDHSLLVDTEERNTGRYDRFTKVSEQLRRISLDYDIILFILLQQNREGKKDENERPKNSSLKESGSWENDATNITFLWYDPNDRRKKMLMTKNRHGGIGDFTLNYWSKTQVYKEAAKNQNAPASGPAKSQKPTKRERAQLKLKAAYEDAIIATGGKVTLRAIAEAADVTTATVKGWIREYGGCTVDGIDIDPAGIGTEVEYTGFIKLTPGDGDPMQEGPGPDDTGEKIIVGI